MREKLLDAYGRASELECHSSESNMAAAGRRLYVPDCSSGKLTTGLYNTVMGLQH